MKAINKSTNLETLNIFWRFTKPYPFLFWYGTIGSVLGTIIASILPPLVVAKAFNYMQQTIARGQHIELSAMRVYIIVYLFLMLAATVIWRTEAYAAWKYGIKVERKLYIFLFDHLQRMGSKFHADRFGGSLVSQVNKFVGAYDKMVGDFTWNIVTTATAFIASIAILFAVSPIYATVLSIVCLVFLYVIYRRMKIQAPYNRRLASSESDQTGKIADAITNISTIRAFAGEDYELGLFTKQADETTGKYFDMMHMQMKNEFLTQSGTNLIDFVAIALGIVAITHFNAPVGTLYLIIVYTTGITNRLWQSMFVVKNVNRSFGDAADMTEILQLSPEVKDIASPQTLIVKDGAILFENVNFSYTEKGKDTAVFNNLSLNIHGGEKIGLVGHSGGGKTTITRLLLRFADIQDGTISLDGTDISKVKQEALRKSLIYVPQEPLLFHRTLAENIRYGDLDAPDEEVIKASILAHADEFIRKLPKGYETLVGERGVKLSGGQRQRVAIARAMLKNAPILVLDEATSALDSESEALIQDALWKLMESRTAIVIAHRLSTIQKMDRILVLENGKIVEEGNHKELLAKNGIYAKLWTHQSGGFIEE